MRTAILRSIAILLALLLVGAGVIFVHPTVLTGRYYELTVRSIEFGELGNVTVSYDEVLTYDTHVRWEHSTENSSGGLFVRDWKDVPPGFLHWPKSFENRTIGVFLTTKKERAEGKGDSPALRERLLLKVGTYRLRSGERLVYYQRTDPDGSIIPWAIAVNPP